MPVAAEGYSTCAGVRGDLYTVIDSHSLGIILPGPDFYGLWLIFSYKEEPHCRVYELVPVFPRVLCASVLHINEEASRRFPRRWEQIFYDAIAKEGTGVWSSCRPSSAQHRALPCSSAGTKSYVLAMPEEA